MTPAWRRAFTTPADLDDVPTTKRFARTTGEAFPDSAEYGAAVEKPAPRFRILLVELTLFVAALWLIWFTFYWLPRHWP